MSKIVKRIQTDNENGSRRALIEDLFYDFNRKRSEVYLLNFVRGIFFGFGSVLGGTLLIAVIIWLLSLLADIPGGVGDFIQYIVDTVQKG
jgi:hypothetical protein